jgi:hypothetical protein
LEGIERDIFPLFYFRTRNRGAVSLRFGFQMLLLITGAGGFGGLCETAQHSTAN